MDCTIHNKPMQEVCGEFKCGMCYEDSLRTERHVRPPDQTYVYPTEFKHRDFMGFGPSDASIARMDDAVERMRNEKG